MERRKDAEEEERRSLSRAIESIDRYWGEEEDDGEAEGEGDREVYRLSRLKFC